MVAVLALLLVAASTALGVVAWLRQRDAKQLRTATEQLTLSITGAHTSIIASGIAAPLLERVQPLLDQLAAKQHLVRDHDRQLTQLLNGLREPAAVHGEQIVFANDAFAALLGKHRGSELVGRLLVDCVAGDY